MRRGGERRGCFHTVFLAFDLLRGSCLFPSAFCVLIRPKEELERSPAELPGNLFALRFVLRRTSAPSHAAPLFLRWIHRSRAHLVSDGSAPLARFPLVASVPCLLFEALGFEQMQL